jgi:Uma2 family endonuclease
MSAIEIAEQPQVARRAATYEQYLEWASETRFSEWVDGEMIEYMPPLPRHQEITWFLFRLLSGFVEALDLGWVGAGPLEFKLWPDGPSREPDVFYVARERRHLLTERRFEGGPDIAVEVISTGSVREDRIRKFTEYERAGVGEYWLIDPRHYKTAAEFYRRDTSGTFQPVEPDDDGHYTSAVLPNFWLDVRWLWEDPLPSYLRALTAIFRSSDAFPPDLRAL